MAKKCKNCVSRLICPLIGTLCAGYNDEGLFWGLLKMNFPFNDNAIDRQRKHIEALQAERNNRKEAK